MSLARLIVTLSHVNPQLSDFLQTIPKLSIRQRKPLLSLARMQTCPKKGTLGRSRLASELLYYLEFPNAVKVQCLDFIADFPYFESPIYSGFISMCLRNFPFPDADEVEEVLHTGLLKEVSAGMEKYLPRNFNWAAILSPDPSIRNSTPLATGYPINTDIHQYLHSSISNALFLLHGKVIYPDYSTKSIGAKATAAVYSMETVTRSLDMERRDKRVSTLDLERIYHAHGIICDGPTEIRSAWKYNDLKPRMYYARGPDVYYASRYIQVIFNTLVDCLEPCHRHLRYAHHTIRFERLWTAFIYDYSSFTSTLDAVTDFVFALADKCEDIPVNLVDTHFGIVTVSLGQLLRDFNSICQQYPSFDLGKMEGDPLSQEFIQTHTCGMLGVPGNISSCTFVHTIHLIIVLGHTLLKVVGDDAFGVSDLNPKENGDIIYQLNGIGKLADEKVEVWPPEEDTMENDSRDKTWEYTKRPFSRAINRIDVGKQFIFPPVAVLCSWKDQFHTVSEEASPFAAALKVIGGIRTFMNQFDQEELEDAEIRFINWFRRYLLQANFLQRKIADGIAPFATLIVPPPYWRVGGMGEDILENYWNSRVTVGVGLSETNPVEFENRGERFVAPSSAAIKLARDLGYVVSEKIMTSFVVRDDPDRFMSFVNRDKGFRQLYTFHVLPECPIWLCDLIFQPYEDDPMSDRIVYVDLSDSEDEDLDILDSYD